MSRRDEIALRIRAALAKVNADIEARWSPKPGDYTYHEDGPQHPVPETSLSWPGTPENPVRKG